MALLNCCSKFLATAQPMHAAPSVCRRFRLDAALRLRWSSMYLDRIVVVRCEEYITCAMSHRTGTQSCGAFDLDLSMAKGFTKNGSPQRVESKVQPWFERRFDFNFPIARFPNI